MIALAIMLVMQSESDRDVVTDWPCADALILRDWDSSVPIQTLASRIGVECHQTFSSQAKGDAAARDGALYRQQMRNYIVEIEGKILNRRLNRPSPIDQMVSPTNRELMDDIESTIVLPPDAKPWNAYGRNYALWDNGQVVAIYLVPERTLTESYSCVHGDGVVCSKAEVRKIVEDNRKRRAAYAAANEQRWFDNKSDLPAINDGGCNQITIRYDIKARRFLWAGCNGR